jgi:hypothetical protein
MAPANKHNIDVSLTFSSLATRVTAHFPERSNSADIALFCGSAFLLNIHADTQNLWASFNRINSLARSAAFRAIQKLRNSAQALCRSAQALRGFAKSLRNSRQLLWI